jgi:cytochrome c551/c552
MRSSIALAAAVAALAVSGASFAGSAEDIIAKEKCSKCHTATTTKKAPSWASIATKYKSNPDAVNKIAAELKAGGKIGDEDDHLAVKASDADLKAIAQIVMSSK